MAFFEGQSLMVTSGGVKQFIYRAETNQTPPLLAAFNPSLTSKDKTVSFLIIDKVWAPVEPSVLVRILRRYKGKDYGGE